MATVYALMSGQQCLYVGHTIQTLQQRIYKHRYISNTCGSKNIPADVAWTAKLLEKCSKDVSRVREQHWIDELKPLYNKVKAYNPLSQPERVKEYQASEEYKKKISTEEYKAYNREAQRKHRAKKRFNL